MTEKLRKPARIKPPFHSFKKANQVVLCIIFFTILVILVRLAAWVS